jgi:hypothetical protein
MGKRTVRRRYRDGYLAEPIVEDGDPPLHVPLMWTSRSFMR